MATTTMKLDRLTVIRDTLIECRKETMDADEWVTFHDMEQRIEEMIHE
ncbi:MAG: hypothetical protein IJ066_11675 [Bacteroidaceae bacterium]|nr:hypothetical protein [Bacteroidaceae bacterium]